MRDPRLRSCVPPSPTSSTEVVLSGQFVSEDPFAEYLWMEHEEDFNRQVEEELLEEEFMERCLQELLEEEEQWEWFIPFKDVPRMQEDQDLVMNSSLNTNAKEFTPGIQKQVM